MENRKLFRMQHDPCAGRCYTPVEVLRLRDLGTDIEATARLLADLIEIHEPACGREQIGFSLDYGDELQVFVAVFNRFGRVSTYMDASPVACLNKLIAGAREWYAEAEAQQLLAANIGDGKDACEHGHDDDLARFALKHSGLSEPDQARVLSRVGELLAAA